MAYYSLIPLFLKLWYIIPLKGSNYLFSQKLKRLLCTVFCWQGLINCASVGWAPKTWEPLKFRTEIQKTQLSRKSKHTHSYGFPRDRNEKTNCDKVAYFF